ncbi:MAG: hypothetical protein DMG13_07570 [Acidobacteria bacterium]|nr:MAG: hypothetical protein DMG13_07570 [Acidobacteriota bacterium]
MEIQSWVTDLREQGYAPNSIDHFHEVMNAVMRTAVTWYKLEMNPARGVQIGRIKPVRKKWALTTAQANALLERLKLKPCTMAVGVKLPKLEAKKTKWALTPEQAGKLIGAIRSFKVKVLVALAIVTSMRRGELLACRWRDFNEQEAAVRVTQAAYQGHIDTPKTKAGVRSNPLDPWTLALLQDWQRQTKRSRPEDFIFGTRKGKIDNPSNLLQRYVYPACTAIGLGRVDFLTLRRTFSTQAHKQGIPPKTIAAMMGHANVDTQLLYIQPLEDAMKREAASKIGGSLSRFCTDDRQMTISWVN